MAGKYRPRQQLLDENHDLQTRLAKAQALLDTLQASNSRQALPEGEKDCFPLDDLAIYPSFALEFADKPVNDIVEHKQAEAALRSALEKLERQNARLQSLYSAGQAVNSTLESGAILDHLVGEAMRLTHATHGQVLIAREDLGLFERHSLHGFAPEEAKLARSVSLPINRGINGQAYTTRQTTCVDDVRAEPDYYPLLSETRSELVIPILRGDRVVGNLDLQSPAVGAFSQGHVDLDFVLALTDQVALALEKARLYERERRHNRELALLNRVIATVAASQDLESILQTTCRELALAFDVPASAAALFNPEKTQAIVVAEYAANAWPLALGAIIPAQQLLPIQHLLQLKAPFVVDSTQADPCMEPIYDLMRQGETISLLILPLLMEREVVGGMALRAMERRAFSADEVDLAYRVAEQVAGALIRDRSEETQRRLSTAVEQAAESIIITDTPGTILYVNPAFERITGYSKAEAIGQNPRLLKSGKHNDAFYGELWHTISAGKAWHGRFVNRRKDGSLYTEDAVITPVRDHTGEIVNYVGTMRDVTREVELEEQFRQAQKMEAVGRLAGGVAHDFNNILTIIHLSARLLGNQLPPQDPLWKHVRRIQDADERATSLTKQLLSFSRREVIEPRYLNLNKEITNLHRMLERLIGEDVELVVNPAQEPWLVYADPTQVEQVILSLAANARDAMPRGGRLTLETANVVLDAAYAATHPGATPGEYVQLTVADTGVGMDGQVKTHLFEPFFTTKGRGQGTGLGLATVYGIVHQNQGHISVESEPSRGTIFQVYLPRASEQAQAPQATPPVEQTLPAPGGETILVVEDEDDVREMMVSILQAQNYRLLAARDGPEALLISEGYDSPIHLLLTDVVMPQMSGRELAERLQPQRPEMLVLYTSGYTEERIAHHGMLEPGLVLLRKPFTLEGLILKVQSILHRPTPAARVSNADDSCS